MGVYLTTYGQSPRQCFYKPCSDREPHAVIELSGQCAYSQLSFRAGCSRLRRLILASIAMAFGTFSEPCSR